jgi:hypothetical protein
VTNQPTALHTHHRSGSSQARRFLIDYYSTLSKFRLMMAGFKECMLLACVAAALSAVQLPGASAQSIYMGLPSFLNNISCSSKATKILGKTLTVSPANICKDFGMGNANVLTCTGEQRPPYEACMRCVSTTPKEHPDIARSADSMYSTKHTQSYHTC